MSQKERTYEETEEQQFWENSDRWSGSVVRGPT